jgi:hypothetical protein
MKNHPSVLLASALASLVCMVGCGGDGGSGASAACGVTPCGGDIAGTWNFTDACIDAAAIAEAGRQSYLAQMPTCTQVSVTGVQATPSGNIALDATNSTYSVVLSVTVSMDVNIPVSCLNGGTCAQLNTQLQTTNPGVFSCTGTSTCVCRAVEVSPSSESGTYTSGTSLLTTPAGTTTADHLDYCVQGTTVTFREPTGDAGAGSSMMTSGLLALVAKKQ